MFQGDDAIRYHQVLPSGTAIPVVRHVTCTVWYFAMVGPVPLSFISFVNVLVTPPTVSKYWQPAVVALALEVELWVPSASTTYALIDSVVLHE